MSAIVVRLVGGLGNQLFQYAAGRAVAIRNGVPLKLDTSWFATVSDRHYALAPYRIEATILPTPPARKPWQRIRKLDLLAARLGRSARDGSRYVESNFRFNAEVLALRAPASLDGFFQSEKYFAAVREQLLSELALRDDPQPQTLKMLRRIQSTDSICLHVRRGDYVSKASTNAYHGTCSLDYYQSGLDIVRKGLQDPHCFIFSDDPHWVREKFRADIKMTCVDIHGTHEAQEDLRLMSACKRFVIANSSLSWWGAWLCADELKVVVAPQRWFGTSDNDTRDLIPDAWLRI